MAEEKQVKKFYKLDEANRLIPHLKMSFIRLFQMNHQLQQLLRLVKEKNMLIDKNHLELDESMDNDTMDILSSIKILLTTVQEEVEQLQGQRIKIKSLDRGIVNIPGEKEGCEINFYWEVGDSHIVTWLDQASIKRSLTDFEKMT